MLTNARSTGFHNHRRPAVLPALKSPVLLDAIVVASGFWMARKFGWPSVDAKDIQTVVATIAQIGSTMLGFMLAALAVLASINHTHLLKMMKRSGHYRDLLLTLFAGCVAFLACTIVCICILFGVEPSVDLMAGLVGLCVGALFSVLDSGRKFWMVLKNLQTLE
jgi:hypothetical protein